MQLRERLRYAGVRPADTVSTAPDPPLPRGFSTGQNRFGRVVFRDQFFPLEHRHGTIRLRDAANLSAALLARLDPCIVQSHIDRAAFLDIETTGLSGGSGTYAFLVGVGTFEALSFRVRQFFLADPSGEAAMLSALGETVERCEAIVTYNGKSFDLPQLTTRFAMMRLPGLGDGLPHLDLLHPARRLFGRSLESCRLGLIERELFGLRRLEDVDSWVIPALYFNYIRRQNLRGLHPVFEHNSLDVVSLVALLVYMAALRDRSSSVHFRSRP